MLEIPKEYFIEFNRLCTEYVERFDKEMSPSEILRIKITLSLFPDNADLRTVLDVGCRDGRIINLLANKYETMAMDIGEYSLRNVKGKKIVGSIEDLPFPDKSYDIIFCTELLEHLTDKVMRKGIEELKRVASKFIIISVPHEENLVRGYVKCKSCNNFHHESGHLQTFSRSALIALFSGWKVAKVSVFGEKESKGMELLYHLLHYAGNGWRHPVLDLCPFCGYQNREPYKRNLVGYLLERLTWFIDAHNPFWVPNKIVLLFEQETTQPRRARH